MRILLLIGLTISSLLLGCKEEVKNVPTLPQNFEENTFYSEDNLHGLLLQLRKAFAKRIVDFHQKNWNLTDLHSKDYIKLKSNINYMAQQYQNVLKYGNLKDSIAADIKEFAQKFIENEKPILLIYGPYADSLAIQRNIHDNEINLKFVGCDGAYLSPYVPSPDIDCVPIGINLRLFTFYNDDEKKLKYQKMANIYKLIAYQKFNEKMLFSLIEKHGFEKVNKILK